MSHVSPLDAFDGPRALVYRRLHKWRSPRHGIFGGSSDSLEERRCDGAGPKQYDVEHVRTTRSRMSREQWQSIYREAWSLYYTPKHMETLLRRAVVTGVPVNSLIKMLVNFATTAQLKKRTSAPGWHIPAQASFGASPRSAARAHLHLLAAVCVGNAQQTCRHHRNDRAPLCAQVYHHA